ncbi:MAG: polysaccharide biosynthesis/export family protein [Planctomycetaceae bacterium]|jgi:polysaccharide export outer membrane protein|nr:polysaccharide biosynthesis/export family protein [Planctomycetaceae bacterium]
MVAASILFSRTQKLIFLISLLAFAIIGCATTQQKPKVYSSLPKEMAKSSLEDYYIGVTDVLTVEVVNLVPKSPYVLQSMDTVFIQAYGLEASDPVLDDQYRIQPGGIITLPYPIKTVVIGGMTCEQAGEELTKKIQEGVTDETYKNQRGVIVSLETVSGLQPISGQHIVGPDGCINLGIYGKAHINGLTLNDAKAAIESVLSEMLDNPRVAIDVFSYNSLNYYVCVEGAGYGDKLLSFPYTGNDTVLDAIANINGLERVSSKHIWVARPSYGNVGYYYKHLEVNWQSIIAGASPHTNYQLLPGDRVFIAEDRLVAMDTKLSKIIAPFERIMGFTLLGAQTTTRFSGSVLKGGGDRYGGGGGRY